MLLRSTREIIIFIKMSSFIICMYAYIHMMKEDILMKIIISLVKEDILMKIIISLVDLSNINGRLELIQTVW